jgi:hypothetical protein
MPFTWLSRNVDEYENIPEVRGPATTGDRPGYPDGEDRNSYYKENQLFDLLKEAGCARYMSLASSATCKRRRFYRKKCSEQSQSIS